MAGSSTMVSFSFFRSPTPRPVATLLFLLLLLLLLPRSSHSKNPLPINLKLRHHRIDRTVVAQEFLNSHNEVRANLSQPPFEWDESLAAIAQRWSAHLRHLNCSMNHSRNSQELLGENLFVGSGLGWRPAEAVGIWANERRFYNVTDNSCAPEEMCGHFTQIVWNTTLRVGCGSTDCITDTNTSVIIVCNYDPPGNYVGEWPFDVSKVAPLFQ